MHAVATKLNELRTELGSFFRERDEAIYAMLLAILAGEHCFILGPPGTAKSELIRAMIAAFKGASYFEILLSKNRPVEAVLGPLDLPHYRATGEYKLKRAGYATAVNFLMLDEVGKMSPLLGHDLLALLNERIAHEVNEDAQGGHRSTIPAPLHSTLAASNETITNESDDAAAMWDRLLVRVIVDYVKDKSAFASLLTVGKPTFATTVDYADLEDVVAKVIPAIPLTDDALVAVVQLRERLRKEHINPSDRRFRASVRVMQAAAFLDGRSEVTEDDVAALRFTLWDTVEQVDKVATMCLTVANPFYEDLMQIRSGLQELALGITERLTQSEGDQVAYGKEANRKLKDARTALDTLMRQSPNKPIPGFKAVAGLHETVQVDTFVRMMGQDPDIAEAAVRNRVGLGDGDEFWGLE